MSGFRLHQKSALSPSAVISFGALQLCFLTLKITRTPASVEQVASCDPANGPNSASMGGYQENNRADE
jgi:hypothetical protein